MAFIPVIEKCAGINNKLDIKSIRGESVQSGITDLAEGVNVDIDDAWKISVRLGQEEVAEGTCHSIYCAGPGMDCYAAKDTTTTAIHQVSESFTIGSAIVSGLTLGADLSWARMGNRYYYTNGYEKGYVADGVSGAWPTNALKSISKKKVISPAPTGEHLAYWMGRMWISLVDGGVPVIYGSLLYREASFVKALHRFQYSSRIRMMRPIGNGMFVSDEEKTYFIQGARLLKDFTQTVVQSFPAHEWSDNQTLVDLSKTHLQLPGLCAVWSSDEGQCIGTPDGQVIVDTKDKLFYPSGTMGATVVADNILINSVY